MTKERQKKRKEARRKGLTQLKHIPMRPPLPELTEEELAEVRRRQQEDFEAGFGRSLSLASE